MDLQTLERLAWANNDQASLALIEAIEGNISAEHEQELERVKHEAFDEGRGDAYALAQDEKREILHSLIRQLEELDPPSHLAQGTARGGFEAAMQAAIRLIDEALENLE